MRKKHSLFASLFFAILLSFVSCTQPSTMNDKVKAMFDEAGDAIASLSKLEEGSKGITIEKNKDSNKIIAKDYVYHLDGKEYTMNGSFTSYQNESGYKTKTDFSFSPELPLGCATISFDLNKNLLPNEKIIVTINGKNIMDQLFYSQII